MFYLNKLEIKVVREAVTEERPLHGRQCLQASDAAELMRSILDADREKLVCLHLDAKHRVQGFEIVAIGSLTAAIIHPREVFKAAILDNSNSIIIMHNHPSGDTAPSAEDIAITDKLREAGNILGITLLDHVIVAASGDYTSFAEKGLI